jgi:hypothetical protein
VQSWISLLYLSLYIANANFLEGFKFSNVDHQLISSILKYFTFKPQNTIHHQFNVKKMNIFFKHLFFVSVKFLTINTDYVPKQY